MSLKVTADVKPRKAVPKKYPRLMYHTPTGSVVLQYGEREAIKMLDGDAAPDWSKQAGPNWLITGPENYIPYVGKLTLENE